MAQNTIKVRLTSAKKYPAHGRNRDAKGWPRWERWRGKTIEVFSDPMKPDGGWTCGTKAVYQATSATIERIAPRDPIASLFNYCVCEHQIRKIKRG
jgi:hypothetical protein